MFSELIKNLRIEKRLTLREFCQQIGFDPSNWSKIERGVNPPPGDITFLEKLAEFFGLTGQKKQDLFDAAAIGRHELPADIAENKMFMKALPAFFRAARGHELADDQLAAFAEEIKKLNQPDPQR
jgi:transcriptional regulator with XRE-family HTH domain